MKIGAVDIGTNSMRLLITDGTTDQARLVEVTGLGEGLDATRHLGDRQMTATLDVLGRFGEVMESLAVDRRVAIATSATRDAINSDLFIEKASMVLGVVPEVIDGDREARLAYDGATSDLDGNSWIVTDIGGGSTEFATETSSQSIDIGSVRLNDRVLVDRPASSDQMARAATHVSEMFETVDVPDVTGVVGAAGTWTSLAAMDLGLDVYRSALVHHHCLSLTGLVELVSCLTSMTIPQTEAAFPALDPRRAPVILSGAVVAVGVMKRLRCDEVMVSERDSLDGLAAAALALA